MRKTLSGQEHAVYRFADCELDPQERRLRVHGQSATLTPKMFQTLVLLVERAGRVVSKNELMAALWPRGFVHESNLTKHIWVIRQTLGCGVGDEKFIETIPKAGYRFVSPVICIKSPTAAVSSPEAVDPADPAPPSWVPPAPGSDLPQGSAAVPVVDIESPPQAVTVAASEVIATVAAAIPARKARPRWLALVALVALLGAVAGAYWWQARNAHATTTDPSAVAIMDFNNLSDRPGDAWLGPALEQMLATEVAAGGKMRVVSDELVRPARSGLPKPAAGGYAPASLAILGQRLGARYVLSGAYLVTAGTDAPQLRVDVTVQDVRGGKPLATLSRTTAVNDLPALVAQIGGDLRSRLGTPAANPAELQQLAAAQPASAQIARHMALGTQALDAFDASTARDELLQAVALSPAYAPAYLQLSRAWSQLGYRAKAVAALRQAAQHADGLPQAVQLQIRAQQSALSSDIAGMTAARAALLALRPSDPDVRLQWIAALIAGKRFDLAQGALETAGKRPELRADPRVELAAAQLAQARGNMAAAVVHAQAARQQAQARGLDGLAAQAQLQLGIGQNHDAQAETSLRGAAAAFHALRNPHGEAFAWQLIGNLQSDRNQIAAARESYQRAMVTYQGAGDLGGEAAIYDNLATMLWAAGDRDGTQDALRQALDIARQTADAQRQAWTLTALATVMSDESAGDAVEEMYRQAIALDIQAGDGQHLAFAWASYADVLRMAGKLDAAHSACANAQAAEAALPADTRTLAADFECAQIALDRGPSTAAEAAFSAIAAQATTTKDALDAANAQLVLAQIAMGRKQWRAAQALLQRSGAGWKAMQETPGQAVAAALLAQCADAQNDAATRDGLVAQARDLRSGVTVRAEVFGLDVTLAQLQAAQGKPDPAQETLRALIADAGQRHWPGLAFEARLALLRVREHSHGAPAVAAEREALIADARKAGYGWVSERAAAP